MSASRDREAPWNRLIRSRQSQSALAENVRFREETYLEGFCAIQFSDEIQKRIVGSDLVRDSLFAFHAFMDDHIAFVFVIIHIHRSHESSAIRESISRKIPIHMKRTETMRTMVSG